MKQHIVPARIADTNGIRIYAPSGHSLFIGFNRRTLRLHLDLGHTAVRVEHYRGRREEHYRRQQKASTR